MADVQNTTDINLNHNWLVLDTIRRMRDSESEKDFYKYYVFFENALQLSMPYLPLPTRKVINDDITTLKRLLRNLKEGTGHKDSQQVEAEALCKDFADTHKFYIFSALQKSGIIIISEEGRIDFDKIDFDTMTQIIRAGGGTPSTIISAMERKEIKDHEAAKP